MPPKKSQTPSHGSRAELLMQPAFIRVIDHIGKQPGRIKLEGTYQDVLICPWRQTDETKVIVTSC